MTFDGSVRRTFRNKQQQNIPLLISSSNFSYRAELSRTSQITESHEQRTLAIFLNATPVYWAMIAWWTLS